MSRNRLKDPFWASIAVSTLFVANAASLQLQISEQNNIIKGLDFAKSIVEPLSLPSEEEQETVIAPVAEEQTNVTAQEGDLRTQLKKAINEIDRHVKINENMNSDLEDKRNGATLSAFAFLAIAAGIRFTPQLRGPR